MRVSNACSLTVAGASLHYVVRGSGPVLLMIPGGPMDGDGFAAVAGPLAERYTVVTYDPRGLSRSRLQGSPPQPIVDVMAADASQLLAAMGSEPACVFGTSGGGVIGLELVARHPEQVRTIVIHEPAPSAGLLSDGARVRAGVQAAYDTYRDGGVWPGMQRFLTAAGLEATRESGPSPEPTPEMLESRSRFQANAEFFLSHYLLPVADYMPDIRRLQEASTRIVVGVGEASPAEQVARNVGIALAERLGESPVAFPGEHGGFTSHPEAFAEKLRQVLRGEVP